MKDRIKEGYFAAKDAKDCAQILMGKIEAFIGTMQISNYHLKLRRSWMFYHGAFHTHVSAGHQVTFSGEEGELAQLPINHYRNIASHMHVMITSNRPALESRAVNSDYKSLIQATLANGLLDYYMREKKLEVIFKDAVEQCIILGSAFVKIEWNATAGEAYEYDEETGEDIYQGDANFSVLSPFDVVFDTTKDHNNHDWYIVRQFKNKYDLMAKYPELADRIESLPTKQELFKFGNLIASEETDDMPVYEFFHKKTEAIPQGRYMIFLDNDVVLFDGPLPYREIPVYRIAPNSILGTPFGYTSMFDIMPIQEAINALYTTVLTNQNAFGVQNVLVPRGTDLTVNQLEGGLNFIEYNAQMGAPAPLNLTNTPREIFDFIRILENMVETISGVNSVARGNPESSLKSGTALALVQSMALQFISGLQQSYVMLIESVGTGLVNILKDYAKAPRIAAIVGKSHRTEMREFTGDDLNLVNRVVVDMGNPLSKCLAKDTPILMYDGSIKMVQNIKIGEEVMGPDSGPRTVISANSGQEMMYEITSKDPNRNIKYGCNESHILTLKYCSDDYRYDVKKGDILDISIKDYLELPERHRRLLQGFTVGVEYSEKDLTIPPYILGAWLGDGTSATTALTSMDKELVEAWSNYANSLEMQVRVQEIKPPNKAKTYFITSGEANGASNRNPMMNHLRGMELINNKHIPFKYLTSSRSQRLELLAGLIDTDGHRIDETFIFTQKNELLSNQVVQLAKSLGFRVTCKKFKVNPSKLVGKLDTEYHKISIGGDTWEIPTKLPRKQAKQKEKARDPLNYGIQIECKGFGTYYGFTLEEEPHFLLGDFTVTHNTTAGRVQMAEQLLQMQAIKTPQQYLEVINTGRLDVMTEDTTSELLNIRRENERLLDGRQVTAISIDNHILHINEHKTVLNDPELREDPNLVQVTLDHIQHHIDLLQNTNPVLLQAVGQQSIPVPQAPPGNQGQLSNIVQQPEQAPQVGEPGQPNMPKPPAPFQNLPVTPQQLPGSK